MKHKSWKTAYSAILIIILLLSSLPLTTSVVAVETRNLVILGTSDVHGNIDNYDYFTDSVPTGSSQRGLTKISTYVKQVRALFPPTPPS